MSRPLGLRGFVACAFVLFPVARAAPCAAEPEVARALEHGLELRRAQRDEEALAEFRRAYALDATPRARVQMALAEQALGRWRDAEADLEAALSNQEDTWIAANRIALQSSRAEIALHLATVRVTSNVLGAQLRLNGAAPVPLPQSLRVETGDMSLRVEAPGFNPIDRVRRVTGGEVLDEDFALVYPPPSPPPICPPEPSGPPVAGSIPPPSHRSSSRAVWGWATIGAAALPLAFGVVESILRDQHARAYNDNTRCPPGYKEALCGDERASADTATVLSVVGYAGAAALASVGAVLVLTSRDSVRVTAWSAPGGAMTGVTGSF
jgi:hypothetical protein